MGGKMQIKYKGKFYRPLVIDFDGVLIRKGEPSVIIRENDGCIPLSDCELIYPYQDIRCVTEGCERNVYEPSDICEVCRNK